MPRILPGAQSRLPARISVEEFERLKEKAARGSYEKFRQLMAKVPAVRPPEYDRL
jgi:hypothetical protein